MHDTDAPLTKSQFRALCEELEGAITETDRSGTEHASQLTGEQFTRFTQIPTLLHSAIESGNKLAAINLAEELVHKAEKFAYVTDDYEVIPKALHIFNELVYLNEETS